MPTFTYDIKDDLHMPNKPCQSDIILSRQSNKIPRKKMLHEWDRPFLQRFLRTLAIRQPKTQKRLNTAHTGNTV
jgi:hypothetical protein